MCSTIDQGEKGYKLLEQILFNFLVLFPTLSMKIRSFPSKLPMALHYLMDLGLHCLPLPHKKDYFVIEYILQHLTRQ